MKFCHRCRHKLVLGVEKFCPNCSIKLEFNNSEYKESSSHISDNQGTVFGTDVTGNENAFRQDVINGSVFNFNISGMSKEDKEQLQKFIFTSEQLKQQPLNKTMPNFLSSLQAKVDELSKIYEQIKNVLDKVNEEEKNKGINIQEIKIGEKQISKNDLSLKENILKDKEYYYKQTLANINKDTYEKTNKRLNESLNLDPENENTLESYKKVQSLKPFLKKEQENVINFFSRTLINDSSVLSVAISPDGTKIVSGESNIIKIWDLESGKLLDTLKGHFGYETPVAISPDGTKIVSKDNAADIKIWDLDTGKLINTLISPLSIVERTGGERATINSLTISPDGTKIISGFSFRRRINVWDLDTGKLINTFTASPLWSVHSVTISPDGTKILGGLENNVIKIWDLDTGKLINTLKNRTRSHNESYIFGSFFYINSVAISPDGTKIISGSQDKTIKIWNLDTGKLLDTLKGHFESINSVAISPDGTKIISGSQDKTIKIWSKPGIP